MSSLYPLPSPSNQSASPIYDSFSTKLNGFSVAERQEKCLVGLVAAGACQDARMRYVCVCVCVIPRCGGLHPCVVAWCTHLPSRPRCAGDPQSLDIQVSLVLEALERCGSDLSRYEYLVRRSRGVYACRRK